MTFNVSVKGGTGAGVRKPFEGGHSPACACSRCEKDKEAK